MSTGSPNASPLSQWPRPLCFVFSGGASYGAAQVGMVRALVESDIAPDMVVGSSVGALNGMLLAHDPTTAADRMSDIWSSMSKRGVFGNGGRIRSVVNATRNGLRKNSVAFCNSDSLHELIVKHTPVERLEDLPIPTGVVVTDALVGAPKVLARGSAVTTLLASAAIPGVFPPVKLDGCFYMDGGVTANVPIRQAISFGARSLIVLNANPSAMSGTLPNSVMDAIVHASMIMLRNQRADTTDELAARYPILHIPQVTPSTHNSFDFDHSAELLGVSYVSTKEFLSQLPDLTDSTRGISKQS